MEGGVARDAHRFANAQWGYIVKKQSTAWGRFVDKNITDAFDVPRRARVTVSEYPPSSAAEFPPFYKERKAIQRRGGRIRDRDPDYVPVITMGRYGKLLKKARPSDDGIVAMLGAAQSSLRLALQDLGPVNVPNTKKALPGMHWPKAYMEAMAKVIWERNVDVEIVLSNPGSVPGDLSPLEACYGLGWSCVDVAAEIIKTVKRLYPAASDGELRARVETNLRVCFLRSPNGNHYKDGQTLGLHCTYIFILVQCNWVSIISFFCWWWSVFVFILCANINSRLFLILSFISVILSQRNTLSLTIYAVTSGPKICTFAIWPNGGLSLMIQKRYNPSRHSIGILCGKPPTSKMIAR